MVSMREQFYNSHDAACTEPRELTLKVSLRVEDDPDNDKIADDIITLCRTSDWYADVAFAIDTIEVGGIVVGDDDSTQPGDL